MQARRYENRIHSLQSTMTPTLLVGFCLLVAAVVTLPSATAFSNPLHHPTPVNTVRSVLPIPVTTARSVHLTKRQYHLASSPSIRYFTSLNASGGNEDDAVEKTSDAIDINQNGNNEFDVKTTVAIVGGQSLLIVGAIIIAAVIGTPNLGLGPNFALTGGAFGLGIAYTLPLGAISVILDKVEDKFPELQDVTKATNRSVLALLGGKFKPLVAIITAVGLGLAAGIGEEMLFRGILQWELGTKFVSNTIAVVSSSIIFGILHAVTPLYAILATLASFYFGFLYLSTGNLLVPIVTHGFYDVCALFYAHWTVAKMSPTDQDEIANWDGPLGSGL